MRKINLKNLSNEDVLTRDELKNILGGAGNQQTLSWGQCQCYVESNNCNDGDETEDTLICVLGGCDSYEPRMGMCVLEDQ